MSRFFKKFILQEGDKLPLRNPYTNKILHELPFQALEQRISELDKQELNFKHMKKSTTEERIEMLEEVLSTINNERNVFTEMITESTGKPIEQSKVEFDQMLTHTREYINIFKSDLQHLHENNEVFFNDFRPGVTKFRFLTGTIL